MSFHYLTNVSVEQAKGEFLSRATVAGFSARQEAVLSAEAGGRVTANAVYAAICAPHYPASAMDGIVLAARDTFGASETTPVLLGNARFKAVDTGDPIPEGCDAVVMIEEVFFEKDGSVQLYAPAAPWQNIRQIGEDICAGEMILPSYTAVSPAAIGALLAGGVTEIKVLAKPVIGIIPTGDEIVPPTASPGVGDIIEFNSAIFSATVREWGAEPRVFPIVPDDREKIASALKEALECCDIVLINAGSSAGREDYTAEAVQEVGEMLFHGIAMKPGKPAILGLKGEKPIIGVPGYPVSGILVIKEFLKPLIDCWYRRPEGKEPCCQATLTRPIVSGLKYREYIRVRLGYTGKGLTATPLNRGSGVVTSFMKADGILEIPQGVEGYEAGTAVTVRLLKESGETEGSVVAIGSHDPLLDEVTDLLHRLDSPVSMNSVHVGSMGGIMAVRRGEAHVAGVHLLCEEDGSYNTAFVKKYFPTGGVNLVECVGRSQGLMVAKGNPLGIKGIADLKSKGLRYVNRQKGSGTRILIDYLCKKEGIDTETVYGYDREEFTHTSVAAQIANKTADAGMGIYSAARLYDLDFVAICNEQYDLLIPDSAMELPQIKSLLKVLASGEFKSRLESMGGYTVENPGKVRKHF